MAKVRQGHEKGTTGYQGQHRHDLGLQNRNNERKMADLMARSKGQAEDVKGVAKQKPKSPSKQAHQNNDSFVLLDPSRDPVLTGGDHETFEDLRKEGTSIKCMGDARRQLWDDE
ncbi:hypothetical protein N0V84_012720 [Fusarium piperis]|uniref:Uncharacterized protein n=1 Tax=Fusarium piperis TaxID=1435070 RepID=A0A9W8TC04_9HYPO|nr:hypothetical protein N0V84_012720 [Fusarium piperis]